MELKSNKIKSMNDFIGGILLGAGGLWLMLSDKITQGRILTGTGQGMVRADTYIRMLGGLVFFLAFLMIIRSFNFKKEAETEAFKFHMSKESFITFIALILFVIFLRPLGFAVATFLFAFTIITVYMLKETKDTGLNRKQLIKKIGFAAGFSLILVFVVFLVFEKVLLVMLP